MGRARDAADASLHDELEHERRERARDEASLGEMLVHIAELERGLREAGRATAEAEARARDLAAEVEAATAERDALAARLRALTDASDAAAHEVRAALQKVETLEHELRAAIEARARAERDSIELAAEAEARCREAEASARELEGRITELEGRLETSGRELEATRESAARSDTTRHALRGVLEELHSAETRAAQERSSILERARALLDAPDVEPRVGEKVTPVRAAPPPPPPVAPPVAPHLTPVEELTLELSELEDG